jgi:hypothetical protein
VQAGHVGNIRELAQVAHRARPHGSAAARRTFQIGDSRVSTSQTVVGTAVLAALVFGAAPVRAQPGPRHAPGADTLRYRERAAEISTLESPTGVVSTESSRDAQLALRFDAPDRVTAWFDALTVRTTDLRGTRSADAAALRGAAFTLSSDGRGRLRAMALPAIPPAVDSLADLRLVFDDLLLVLPDAPMMPGLTWSDTWTRELTREGDRTMQMIIRRSYVVQGDTATAYGPAWLIRTEGEAELTSSTPVAGTRQQIVAEHRGSESGIVLWHRSDARLLALRRTTELRGSVTISGQGAPMRLPSLRRLERSVDLERP